MTLLTADAINRLLRTRRLGRPALVFERIGSTNDVAHQQARQGGTDGLLVVAEEQTAGRGRLDRKWWAPPGTCLLMSLLLSPSTVGRSLPVQRCAQLTMCLGLGAAAGVAEVTGIQIQLKWPNDLLVGGRKLGGMLTELIADENRLDYAVLGLGLNVNLDFVAEGAPPEIAASATSLQTEAGRTVDRVSLLAAVLMHTERWYEQVLAGISPHEEWARRLDTIGRHVIVSLSAGSIEGVAVGVNAEGGLLVQDENGSVTTVWSGDVTAVR